MKHTIAITEGERQMLLLALAQLALRRPGWDDALGRLAAEVPGGRELFDAFKETWVNDLKPGIAP